MLIRNFVSQTLTTMASITFHKYQGAGNDFIVIDDRNGVFDVNNEALVKRLCDRRYGIGADGLMLLQAQPGYDFKMVYFNADGREGSMCGNGGRCMVAFARHQGLVGDNTVFLAVDGEHHADINAEGNWVSLQMIDVPSIAHDGAAYLLDTGSPHYVQLVDNLANFPVYERGYAIRNSDAYRAEGINVNFVEPEGTGYFVRTYERGVENETLACGTGATAVALAMAAHEGLEGDFQTPIRVLGGNLAIKFRKTGDSFTDVYLEGPAAFVFSGKI